MCGFAGILSFDGAYSEEHNDTLMRMIAPLKHRGPDDFGSHWNGGCGLAHQRLSIIDLSKAGRQPMSNEDGTVWIAYNGEVYNFRELRAQFALDSRGHRFSSRTDTEVIVHLFEELGLDSFRQLNGMYAFAIWDAGERTLHLARDPYGIKPLFYLQTKDAFFFASEIKALLAVPGIERSPSLESLHHFLGFDYMPGTLTAFEHIHELAPGHRLSIDVHNHRPEIRRFFDIEYTIHQKMTEKEAIDQSSGLLFQAVERQLISDVPVGVMLSGGMDSSALTAFMARVRGNADFHTFSIGFEDESFDESRYASLAARHVGTHHHAILVTPDKVRELLPKYLAYIDEPYADGSAIPTYLLSECAREHVTVLLSGEGGDEFYSGYDTHAAYKMRALYRRLPRVVRQGLIQKAVQALPTSFKKLSFDFKAKRFVRGAELDVPVAHYYWRVVLSEDAKGELLKDRERFSGFVPSEQLFVEVYRHCQAVDELNRLLYIDYSYHLPDDLMIKNDRMTMAHSLEARVPFTDNDLVLFLATVPVKYKMKGVQKKFLLRSSFDGILPREILKKKKVGLEMPYSRWFINEWREMIEDIFAEDKVKATGLFNPQGVQRIWGEHRDRKVDHGRALWGLLNYLLWYEAYIEKGDFASYLSPPRPARIGATL